MQLPTYSIIHFTCGRNYGSVLRNNFARQLLSKYQVTRAVASLCSLINPAVFDDRTHLLTHVVIGSVKTKLRVVPESIVRSAIHHRKFRLCGDVS